MAEVADLPPLNSTNKCRECGKKCKSRAEVLHHEWMKHRLSDAVGLFPCDSCQFVCQTLIDLRQHRRTEHSRGQSRSKGEYKCGQCGVDCKHVSGLCGTWSISAFCRELPSKQ